MTARRAKRQRRPLHLDSLLRLLSQARRQRVQTAQAQRMQPAQARTHCCCQTTRCRAMGAVRDSYLGTDAVTAVPVVARSRRLRWESTMRVLCQDLDDAAGAARHDLQVR